LDDRASPRSPGSNEPTREALAEAQRELAEARRRERATAEVVRIIGRSAFDLKSVLQQLIGSAVRISGAVNGSIHLRDGDAFPFKESYGHTPEIVRFLAAHPLKPGRATIVGRVSLSGRVETIADVLADTDFDLPVHQLGKVRSVLGAPSFVKEGSKGFSSCAGPIPVNSIRVSSSSRSRSPTRR
jgi:hypothetical protein